MRIAVLDDYQGVAARMADWDSLAPRASVEIFNRRIAGQDELARSLAPFDALVVMRERTPFPRVLLERLPALRLLVTTGHRNRAVDLDAASDLGIQVCGTGLEPDATSELTWALILAVARNIPREVEALRAGTWQVGIGRGLRGKTLGTLGLGRMGSRVAAVGLAFGMRVIAWSQNLTAERAAEVGVERVGREELFGQSDVLTVHLVLSPRSRGLVGAAELALMKPTAILVNTSRGPIVEEAALLTALREGRIAGAGLDVYDEEPLPAGHPLLSLESVVATPHLGYVTEDNYRLAYGDAVAAIAAYLGGEILRPLNEPPRPRG